jgi:hypothetical protein
MRNADLAPDPALKANAEPDLEPVPFPNPIFWYQKIVKILELEKINLFSKLQFIYP